MIKRVALILALFLAGCTIPVVGKENFLKQARSEELTVPMPIADLYGCLVSNVNRTGYSFLNEKRGFAEWSSLKPPSWDMMIRMWKIDEGHTKVRLYQIEGGANTAQISYYLPHFKNARAFCKYDHS